MDYCFELGLFEGVGCRAVRFWLKNLGFWVLCVLVVALILQGFVISGLERLGQASELNVGTEAEGRKPRSTLNPRAATNCNWKQDDMVV